MEHRLAAILVADVVGYSRLMNANEIGTLNALLQIQTGLIDRHVGAQKGRIVKLMGDGVLAEFPSVVGALQAALDIQQSMVRQNLEVPLDRQIQFRIGINLGEVIIEDGDIYGDGVNIAARLETLALPGGIAVSGAVREQARNKLEVTFEAAGDQYLKNIDPAIPVFLVSTGSSQNNPAKSESGAAATANTPSVAVLPFANMSGNPEQEYFSDGITEDLITDLSKIPGLFVVSRNSSFVYKGKSAKMQDVARELGVGYVLEGSVRTSGQRVRITAQLIDGVTGGHVWAERYDRDLTDIFALQDEITKTITGQLQVRLIDSKVVERVQTSSVEAYNCYLRGRQFYHMRSKGYLERARESFLEALRHDPSYARAYVGLADCESRLNEWHGGSYPIDDIIAMTHRASDLEPNMAEAHAAYALALQVAERYGEAAESYQKALEIDPLCYEAHHSYARLLRGTNEKENSIYHFTRSLELMPEDYRSPLLLSSIYHELECFDDRDNYLDLGLKRAEDAAERNPDNPDPLEIGASVLVKAGRSAQAMQWLERALAVDPDRSVTSGYNIACTYALVGEIDAAFEWLERILDKVGPSHRLWMENDADLDNLRDHPRFRELLPKQVDDC